jgi:hypothetical protein
MAEPRNKTNAQFEHHQAIGVIDPCLDDKSRFVREITRVFDGVQWETSPKNTAAMSMSRATLLVDAWQTTCEMADRPLLLGLFKQAMMRNDGSAAFYVFGFLKSKMSNEELPSIFDKLLDYRGVLCTVHSVGDVQFTKVALKCEWPADQYIPFVNSLLNGFYAIPRLSEGRIQQLRDKPTYEDLSHFSNDVRMAKAKGQHKVSDYTHAIFEHMASSDAFLDAEFQENTKKDPSLRVYSVFAHALHGMDMRALRLVLSRGLWTNFELAQTMQITHFLGCTCDIEGYNELARELFYTLVNNDNEFPVESITRRPCLTERSVHCSRRLDPKFKYLHMFVGLGHQSAVFALPSYKYAKQDFDMTIYAIAKLSPPVGDLIALLEEATSVCSANYIELALDALQSKTLPTWWSGEQLVDQRNFLSASMTNSTFKSIWLGKVLRLGWHENAFAEALAMAVASHDLENARALLGRMQDPLPKMVPKFIKSDFELGEGSSSGSKRTHDKVAPDTMLFLSKIIVHLPELLANLLVHQPTRDSLTKEVVARTINRVLDHCAQRWTKDGLELHRLESYRSYLEDLLLLPFEISVDDVKPCSDVQPFFESLLEKLFAPPSADNPRGGRGYAPLVTSFSTNAVIMDEL